MYTVHVCRYSRVRITAMSAVTNSLTSQRFSKEDCQTFIREHARNCRAKRARSFNCFAYELADRIVFVKRYCLNTRLSKKVTCFCKVDAYDSLKVRACIDKTVLVQYGFAFHCFQRADVLLIFFISPSLIFCPSFLFFYLFFLSSLFVI